MDCGERLFMLVSCVFLFQWADEKRSLEDDHAQGFMPEQLFCCSFDPKGEPSMTLVSLTDCCRWLAIDPKTLRRWLSLAHLSAQPHPLDARLKCLTSAQIQQLATTHRRVLPDFEPLHCRAEVIPLPPPTAGMSASLAPDILPDFFPPVTDLTMHLSSLQAQVVMLQHQLTLLTQQLQKEQEWRASQASTFKDKSLESSSDKSLESSLDKSLESSPEKESARSEVNTASIDRRKHRSVLPLVEYGAGGKYVVISPGQGLLQFEPDSPEWFAWLSTQISFRFVGVSGHLTVHRKGCSPRWTWRGTRSIRSRSRSLHLVRTEFLTIAVLEQAAASLQSLLN